MAEAAVIIRRNKHKLERLDSDDRPDRDATPPGNGPRMGASSRHHHDGDADSRKDKVGSLSSESPKTLMAKKIKEYKVGSYCAHFSLMLPRRRAVSSKMATWSLIKIQPLVVPLVLMVFFT